MPDNVVLVQQVVAARALLGWSQDELAARSGVSASIVTKLEGGAQLVGADDLAAHAIRSALESAGIEFTRENGNWIGVRLRTLPFDASATERRIDDLEASAAGMDVSGPASPRRAMNTMKRAIAGNDAAKLREKLKRTKREEPRD